MGCAGCCAVAADAGDVNLDIEGYRKIYKIACFGINLRYGFGIAVALFNFGILKCSAYCIINNGAALVIIVILVFIAYADTAFVNRSA